MIFQKKIKKNKFFLLIGLLSSFPVILNSCSLEENPDSGKIIVQEVNSDIDTITFWNGSSVYIIKKSNFKVNSNLFIQAGAIVKFDMNNGRSITISDSGYISAVGTISKPVIFTSIKDDFYGGDNNNDKSQSKPQQGDWDGIIDNGKLMSSFSLCYFSYGGGGSTKSTIETADSVTLEISDCVFAYNDGGSIEKGEGVINLRKALATSRLKRNIFYGNNLPLQINTDYSLDASNLFYNTKNINEANIFNVILVNSLKPIISKIIWAEDEIAFYIRNPKLTVSRTGVLVMGNKATIKFEKGTLLELDNGKNSLLNYDGPDDALTSIYDDKIKGDSNGDKTASSPSNPDWFVSIARDSASFNWKTVFYARYLLTGDK